MCVLTVCVCASCVCASCVCVLAVCVCACTCVCVCLEKQGWKGVASFQRNVQVYKNKKHGLKIK